jgi:hypothetical protein
MCVPHMCYNDVRDNFPLTLRRAPVYQAIAPAYTHTIAFGHMKTRGKAKPQANRYGIAADSEHSILLFFPNQGTRSVEEGRRNKILAGASNMLKLHFFVILHRKHFNTCFFMVAGLLHTAMIRREKVYRHIFRTTWASRCASNIPHHGCKLCLRPSVYLYVRERIFRAEVVAIFH